MLLKKLTNFNRSHFFIVFSYAFAKPVGDEQVWDRTSRETKTVRLVRKSFFIRLASY
jgi:hypothetical protein